MKTQILIEIEHHDAVNVFEKTEPVVRALLKQMYTVGEGRFTIDRV